MKKLLTTMSAVAVAMGLYAASSADSGALSGTSFEGLAAADRDPYNISATEDEITGTSGFWSVGASDTLKVIYGVDVSVPAAETSRRPAAFTESDNDYYLEVKTASLTNSISRRVKADGSAVNINGGTTDTKDLYFDSYVQFTAFEGDDDVKIGSNGKLAIWLRENVDGNGDPTSTNLMITAGYLNNTEAGAVPTNYVCTVSANARLFDGGWHRVTVKAIDKIYTSGNNPGFVVFIDSYEVACTDDTTMGVTGTLTDNAQAYYNRHALFPSAVQSGGARDTITAVDFAGQGAVDELVFTRTAPSFAQDNEFFKIIVDENIATAYYSLNNGAWVSMDPGSTNVLLYTAGSTYFTLSNVTAATGFMTNGVAGAGITEDALTAGKYNVTVANAIATIQAKPLAAYVGDTPYETLAAAVDAANAAGSSCTLKLAANAAQGITLANSTEGVTITLDLAGCEIAPEGTYADAIVVTRGAVTIIDSVGGGKVTAAEAAPDVLGNAVVADGGAVTITDGTYDGKIIDASITGGGFLATYKGSDVNTKAALDGMIVGNYVAKINPGTNYYGLAEPAVAQVGETEYSTFSNAFTAACAAGTATLKLLDNVSDVKLLGSLASGTSITLDLNGKTITTDQNKVGGGNDYWLTIASGAALVVTDSTVVADGMIVSFPSNATIFKVQGTFTMAAGTLDMKTVNPNNTASGFNVKDGGTGYMNGGTVLGRIASGESGATLEMNGGAVDIVQSKNGGAVTINGGDVTKTEKSGTGDGTIVIPSDSAARFGEDQTQYCAAGYKTVQTLESGVWYVVVAKVYYSAIELSDATLALVTNETATLTAMTTPASAADDSVIWTTSDATVATVENGVVTAVGAGTATITAKSDHDNTVSDSCTVTVTAPAQGGLDPAAGTISVTVAAASGDAAIAAAKSAITVPAGSGADAAVYAELFTYSATAGEGGTYTVAITGIQDSVVTAVDTSAVALLTSGSGTVAVPAGLYYRITPSTALPISGTAVQGLSTGSVSVTKPGETQGFLKVELSPTQFEQN